MSALDAFFLVAIVGCLCYSAYCFGKGRGMVEIVQSLAAYLDKEGRDALSGRVRRLANAMKAERL